MSDWYVIDPDGQVRKAASLAEGCAFFEKRDARKVDFTDLGDRGRVSTVFLGLDHGWDEGPPVLWETLVFEGPFRDHMERYTSVEDARAGHARIVACLRDNVNPDQSIVQSKRTQSEGE